MANRHTKGSVTSAVIRETKPRGDPPASPRGGPRPERQTTARAGKSADTPQASWAARGDAARGSCPESSTASLLETRTLAAVQASDATPRCPPEREEKMGSGKDLDLNVHSTILRSGQKPTRRLIDL